MHRHLLSSFALVILICAANLARADSESAATGLSSKPLPTPVPTAVPSPTPAPVAAESHVATLTTDDLREYADQPEAVKQLLAQGLALTRLNLSYKYGSSDPKNGGMDCSGTVYYLLHQAGLDDAPRDASEMYQWVWKKGRFESVISRNADTFELDRLKPGDLLFWTGTYQVDRDPPITHVMIYLGTNRQNGHRVMVGASEGRYFDGKPRYGVSVFDFQMPDAKSKSGVAPRTPPSEARFVGYGSIPGLEINGK